LLPGLIFAIEKSYSWFGKIDSFVSSFDLLPSRVTQLVIQKPVNFHFQPGDYVYANFPSIASSEWHPFTISSAPETPGDNNS
jgi:predicted ferric reductase